MKHLLITTIAAVLLVGCRPPDISIHDAAIEGNVGAVKQHLDAGADVNAKSNEEWTPLHYAASKGHKEIAELLIVAGADVNAKGENGWTPLHNVTRGGHKEIVELLIAKGADVNAKDEESYTPLDIAASWGYKEIADLLLEHGSKSGASDSIQVAASMRNIEAVKRHLAAGADVNAKSEVYGHTPLHNAAWGGYKEIAELLIAEGADVNAKKGVWDGRTPLHLAALEGEKEIAELLIAAGADVNAKDDDGDTPLDIATHPDNSNKNKHETADLLRKHGGKTGEELKAEGN
jgi:cytohesin